MDYYGALNELKIGIAKPKIPERPEALVLLEECEALGVTLTGATSLYGHPHIWLQEIAIIKYVRDTFTLLEGN